MSKAKPILICYMCQKPMDEAHPEWRLVKKMGWDENPGLMYPEGYDKPYLNLHSWVWAIEQAQPEEGTDGGNTGS